VIILTATGIDEVIKSLGDIDSVLDRSGILDSLAEDFADELREATPPGYSKRLKDSVERTESEVGYEQGVETAGDKSLDSVTRVSVRGRTVLRRSRWVQPEGLEEVLMSTVAKSAGGSVLKFEEAFVGRAGKMA
jgi:hypothetical protein